MRQFIVTGAARSGTQFISQAFTLLGINCGHEEMFNLNTVDGLAKILKDGGVIEKWGFNDHIPVVGESSWLAAPYLKLLGPDIAIFHQVRDPIDVARSLMGIGFADVVRRKLPTDAAPWTRKHYPEIFAYDNTFDRCIAYWVKWNQMAETHANVRYKIADHFPN